MPQEGGSPWLRRRETPSVKDQHRALSWTRGIPCFDQRRPRFVEGISAYFPAVEWLLYPSVPVRWRTMYRTGDPYLGILATAVPTAENPSEFVECDHVPASAADLPVAQDRRAVA